MRRSVLAALVALLSMVHTTVPAAALAQHGPCAMPASDRWQYVDFMGPWERHAMALDVDPRGCGTLAWGDGVAQPFSVTGFVLDVHEERVASGRIVDAPDATPGLARRIVLTDNGDGTLTVEWQDEPRVFCRPWAWVTEKCGA